MWFRFRGDKRIASSKMLTTWFWKILRNPNCIRKRMSMYEYELDSWKINLLTMSELKKRKVDFKKIIFACFLKTSILTEKESVCECGQFLSRPKGSATQHEVWLSVYNACTMYMDCNIDLQKHSIPKLSYQQQCENFALVSYFCNSF